MSLPPEEDERLYEEIRKHTEEKAMSVLAIAERAGRKKGKIEGRQESLIQGLHRALCDILELKFGSPSPALLEKIESVRSLTHLEQLRSELKACSSPAQAEAAIDAWVNGARADG